MRGKKPKAIKMIDPHTKRVLATYPSIAAASRESDVIRSSIIHCLKGRYTKAGGYIWEYVD